MDLSFGNCLDKICSLRWKVGPSSVDTNEKLRGSLNSSSERRTTTKPSKDSICIFQAMTHY